MQTEQMMMMQPIVIVAKIVQMNVQPDALLRKDQEALQEFLDHLVPRAYKVILVWKVCLDQKETRETLECKALEEIKGTEEKWECLGFQELMESLATWDHLDCLVDLELMVVMELM